MSTGSSTIPLVTFAQLWNFNEQYDHKETNPLSSQPTTATICKFFFRYFNSVIFKNFTKERKMVLSDVTLM